MKSNNTVSSDQIDAIIRNQLSCIDLKEAPQSLNLSAIMNAINIERSKQIIAIELRAKRMRIWSIAAAIVAILCAITLSIGFIYYYNPTYFEGLEDTTSGVSLQNLSFYISTYFNIVISSLNSPLLLLTIPLIVLLTIDELLRGHKKQHHKELSDQNNS